MKTETKVGAFFIASIGITAFLILKMEKLEIFGQSASDLEYMTSFDQVAGLTPNGKIRMAGVPIGEVRRIDLKGGRAYVTFRLNKPVDLYRDATANLSSIGILGEKYIELLPGRSALGLLKPGESLDGRNGANLDNLMKTLESIGGDVKGITASLNQSIGGENGRMKLDEIVDNIRVLTGEFRAMAVENRGSINHTMANVESITADLRAQLPKLAKQFEDLGRNLNAMVMENRPELKGMTGDVRKLAQSFQGTSENLKFITEKLKNGEGTIGKLLTDDATIKKINTAVDNVNELMNGVRNMELRLDLGAARWTKRGDSITGLDVDLAPRKDYWYSIGLHSTPDGKISDSQRVVKKWDPATGTYKDTLEHQRTVTADNSLTVSGQFNKRLGQNMVVSAGIVEGKGGAGAEFRAMEDRFRAGVLAYDFTKRDDKENPRIRFTTSYQFYRGLYLQAGAQDLANKDLRSFFVGGGIRWKDDDLKKLVGLAGAAK